MTCYTNTTIPGSKFSLPDFNITGLISQQRYCETSKNTDCYNRGNAVVNEGGYKEFCNTDNLCTNCGTPTKDSSKSTATCHNTTHITNKTHYTYSSFPTCNGAAPTFLTACGTGKICSSNNECVTPNSDCTTNGACNENQPCSNPNHCGGKLTCDSNTCKDPKDCRVHNNCTSSETCDETPDCKSGLNLKCSGSKTCQTHTSDNCQSKGTCGNGQTCNPGSDNCEAGLTCESDSSKCRSTNDCRVNGNCQNGNTCTPDSTDCGTGLTCESDSSKCRSTNDCRVNGNCPSGHTCTPGSDDCGSGLTCSSSGTCQTKRNCPDARETCVNSYSRVKDRPANCGTTTYENCGSSKVCYRFSHNDARCVNPRNLGQSCVADVQCSGSSICEDRKCINPCTRTVTCNGQTATITSTRCQEDTQTCADSKYCQERTGNGVACLDRKNNGMTCSLNKQCKSEVCDDAYNKCKPRESSCLVNAQCYGNPNKPYCKISQFECVGCLSHTNCPDNEWCYSNQCVNKKPNGASCTSDSQCQSNNCVYFPGPDFFECQPPGVQ